MYEKKELFDIYLKIRDHNINKDFIKKNLKDRKDIISLLIISSVLNDIDSITLILDSIDYHIDNLFDNTHTPILHYFINYLNIENIKIILENYKPFYYYYDNSGQNILDVIFNNIIYINYDYDFNYYYTKYNINITEINKDIDKLLDLLISNGFYENYRSKYNLSIVELAINKNIISIVKKYIDKLEPNVDTIINIIKNKNFKMFKLLFDNKKLKIPKENYKKIFEAIIYKNNKQFLEFVLKNNMFNSRDFLNSNIDYFTSILKHPELYNVIIPYIENKNIWEKINIEQKESLLVHSVSIDDKKLYNILIKYKNQLNRENIKKQLNTLIEYNNFKTDNIELLNNIFNTFNFTLEEIFAEDYYSIINLLISKINEPSPINDILLRDYLENNIDNLLDKHYDDFLNLIIVDIDNIPKVKTFLLNNKHYIDKAIINKISNNSNTSELLILQKYQHFHNNINKKILDNIFIDFNMSIMDTNILTNYTNISKNVFELLSSNYFNNNFFIKDILIDNHINYIYNVLNAFSQKFSTIERKQYSEDQIKIYIDYTSEILKNIPISKTSLNNIIVHLSNVSFYKKLGFYKIVETLCNRGIDFYNDDIFLNDYTKKIFMKRYEKFIITPNINIENIKESIDKNVLSRCDYKTKFKYMKFYKKLINNDEFITLPKILVGNDKDIMNNMYKLYNILFLEKNKNKDIKIDFDR